MYLYDAHGNVTEILDSNYDVCNSYTYDPFGADIISAAESIIRDTDMESLNPPVGMQSLGGGQLSGGLIINHTPVNPYRYCGEYTDIETGYVYLRARYYDPNLGRFISEDSAKDGYNWYVYCGNNPVNYVDPSGEIGLLACILLGAVIGAVTNVIGNGISNILFGDSFFNDWQYAVVEGAISGAFAGTGIGIFGQTIVNAAISAGSYVIKQANSGSKFNIVDFGLSTLSGAIAGLAGGNGARYSKRVYTEIGSQGIRKVFYKAGSLHIGEMAGRLLIKGLSKSFAANTVCGAAKKYIMHCTEVTND